jgi:hypothetical protein
LFPKFVPECAEAYHELRKRGTSLAAIDSDERVLLWLVVACCGERVRTLAPDCGLVKIER